MSNINVNVAFQNDAINTLKKRIKFALQDGGIGEFNFKSCVASGKTVICGRLMQDLIADYTFADYAFVWICTSQGNLCYQSKETIEAFTDFPCHSFEDILSLGNIPTKACSFIPWEQINKSTNKFRGKAEYTTFDKIMEENKSPIILFVDEAHDTYGTENSQEIIELISPALCIKISATPRSVDARFDVEIDIERVIEAGFIKKVIELQKDLIKPDDDSIENILLSAMRKLVQLEEAYESHKVNYTPLCLIQIANDSSVTDKDDSDTKRNKDEIVKILKENGVLDHEIGVWLSEEKTENITDIRNNQVKYLIIKQAVAKGWDCPRAHVLVRLRETRSVVLDIQTIGRVLRTIDKFVGHYNDDLMDSAYIYTNDANFKLSENNNLPTRDNSRLFGIKDKHKDIATSIVLKSALYSKSAPVLRGDNLRSALAMAINSYFISEHGNVDPSKLTKKQLAENSVNVRETIWDMDTSKEIQTKDISLSDPEIERLYELVIRRIYSPFADTLLRYLDEIAESEGIPCLEFYKKVLCNADDYTTKIKEVVESLKKPQTAAFNYKIPVEISVRSTAANSGKFLYISSPVLDKSNGFSGPEVQMAEYLNANNNVLFWFKNKERQQEAFSIVYDNNGGTDINDNFYPDFIVMDSNKTLWILETKGGTDTDIDKKTPEKYTGIQHYMEATKATLLSENPEINDVVFSIVRPLGNTLKIFTGERYKKNLGHSDWVDLNI